MMGSGMPETCWAYKKYNKIISVSSKFAVYDFKENNLSTSSYIHHPLHTHPHPSTPRGHPCSKHQQYVSPATINPYKLEMSFKSNQAQSQRGNLRRM